DKRLDQHECPLWVKSRHSALRKERRYSITLSALTMTESGTVRPSAFAVLRLMTSSNLVGCSTGRSAGLAPLMILSTEPAARLHQSGTLSWSQSGVGCKI